MASPLLLNTRRQGITDATLLFNDYIKNSVFLMNLTTSVGQLVLAGNKLTQIAGYTYRVSELLENIRDLDR